jgi:penicillin-binding protein 1A
VTDYRPKIPLRIYTADNALIGEFGEEHRDFVPIKDIPEMMKKAVLAIEDKRFYEHNGIDWVRALGAAKANLGGAMRQGGSTITMQVARNFFLTREKFYGRKLNEVMLALKIEAALSKDQILELYMNQIYLGQRSFGFGAAPRPTSASRSRTCRSPRWRCWPACRKIRRATTGGQSEARQATPATGAARHARCRLHHRRAVQEGVKETLHISRKGQDFDVHAEYVAELARQVVYAQFKEDSYTKGISVYTTILKADQKAAYESMRRNVLNYDQRHGYRGPEAFITLPAGEEERDDAIEDALQNVRQRRPDSGRGAGGQPESAQGAESVRRRNHHQRRRPAPGRQCAERQGQGRRAPASGRRDPHHAGMKCWIVTQVPQVSAAFVSIDSVTGGYHAMVGGFDYNLQKFNHVTQAWRQPGSSIKPFVYSAALEKASRRPPSSTTCRST